MLSTPAMTPDLLTVRDVARRLRISERTVWRWTALGLLPLPVHPSAEQPNHPTCYEGEWVCDIAPCPVRAVRLRVKAHFYKHLPRLRCPLCLRALAFRHWLNVIALREVPAEARSAVILAPCVKRGVRKKRKQSTGANDTSSA